MQAALLEADFDLNGRVHRLVTNAMNQQRASLGGAFLSAMRDKAAPATPASLTSATRCAAAGFQ